MFLNLRLSNKCSTNSKNPKSSIHFQFKLSSLNVLRGQKMIRETIPITL